MHELYCDMRNSQYSPFPDNKVVKIKKKCRLSGLDDGHTVRKIPSQSVACINEALVGKRLCKLSVMWKFFPNLRRTTSNSAN